MAPLTIDTVALGGFALLVVATTVLLSVQRPTLSRPLVFATLPWLATATVLQSLRGPVDYPGAVTTLLGFPWSYVLMACLCALAWTMLVQLRTSERARAVVPTYLGLMGVGVLLGPVTVLVIVAGTSTSLPELFSWLVTPLAALVATYVALLALGLWLPRAAAFVGSAGGVVLFGATLDAVAAGLAVALGAAPVFAVTAVATPAANALGIAPTAAAVWLVVWLRLVAAVAVLAALALLSRGRRSAAEHGLHAVVVVSVLAGTNALVVAVAGGGVA
jgi:uncharacterized membrane protein